MNEKKSFISCNCKTKLYVYPFLLPVAYMLIRYMREEIFSFSEKDKFMILKFNLPLLFYYSLSKMLAIIFIPIINSNTKGESNEKNQNKSMRKYHLITKNENLKKKLLLIYFISLLEVIFDDCECLLYYYQKNGDLKWLIEKKTGYIIFVPIFSYFILGKVLHRHHILGLVLGFIGAGFVNICRFPLKFSVTEDMPFHLLNILFSSLFSLALVLIKLLFLNYLIISPYTYLFYDGFFCIINSIICTILQYVIVIKLKDKNNKLENSNYFKHNFLGIFTIFSGKNSKFYICFFLNFIFSFCYYLFNVLTIYHYSPFLNVLVELFLPIDNDVLDILFEDKDKKIFNKENIIKRFIIQSVGYLILFFGSLILNEIIILNFWGFNKNTYSVISLRGALDSINYSLNELSLYESIKEDTGKYSRTESEMEFEKNNNIKI